MNELELIVQQMMTDGESDEMIQSVVAEYNKTKPVEEGKTNAIAEEAANVVAEPVDTELQSENGSLESQANQTEIDTLKTKFDQGEFTMDQKEVYEKYRTTGEIKIPKAEPLSMAEEDQNRNEEVIQAMANNMLGNGALADFIPDSVKRTGLKMLNTFSQAFELAMPVTGALSTLEDSQSYSKMLGQIEEGKRFTYDKEGKVDVVNISGGITKYNSLEEAKEDYKSKITAAQEEGAKKIVSSREYQKALSLFGKDPEILDGIQEGEFGEIIRTQIGQMAASTLSLGTSTYAQEAGNILIESVEGLARQKYPEYDTLSTEKQNEIISDIVSKGEIDYSEIERSGAAIAALDFGSNVFGIGKAAAKPIGSMFRNLAEKNLKGAVKAAKGDLSQVLKASLLEVPTEMSQEIQSMSTTGNILGEDRMDAQSIKEAGAQALISSIPLIGGGRVINRATRNIARSGKGIASEVKANEQAIKVLFENGSIDKAKRDEQLTALYEAENIAANSNYKDFEPEAREEMFDIQVEQQLINNKNKELDNSIAPDISGVYGKGQKERNKEKLDKLEKRKQKAIATQVRLNMGDKLRSYINTNKEKFGNYSYLSFNTPEEAKNYLESRGVDLNNENVQGLINGNVYGIKIPGIKTVIDVKSTSNKGQLGVGANVVHHETAHVLFDNLEDSAVIKLAKDLGGFAEKSGDENLFNFAMQAQARVNKFYKNQSERVQAEEFFAGFSDFMRAYEVENGNVQAANALTKFGEKVAEKLGVGLPKSFDLSGLENGAEVITFLRKYNGFNGKPALNLKLTAKKGSVDTDQDEETKKGITASKVVDQINFEEGSVNQEFQKFTYDGKKNTAPESFQAEAAMAYEPLAQAVVDRISKVGLGVSKEQDQFIMDYLADNQNKEDIVSDLTFGTERNKASSLLGLAKSYNPEVGSFGGYAKSQLANRAIRILEERVGQQVTQGAQTLDAPESKEVAADDIDVADIDSRNTIEKLNVPNAIDKVNKLTELSIVKADKALSGKDFTTTKKIAARDKAFYEIFSKQLFNDIKTIVGKNTKNSKDFTKFINNNFDLLSQVALDNIDFQKGGGPSSTWNKMPPTKEEFLAYYEANGEKTSTKSDRKKSLNNAIARQIANEARVKYAEENTSEADRFAEEAGIVLASKIVNFNDKELDASVALVEWYKTIDLNPNLVFKGNTGERLKKIKDIKNKWKSRFGFSIYPGAVAELLTQKDKMLIGFNPKTDKNGNISIKASDSTGGLDLEGLNSLGNERNIEVKQGMNDIHGSGSFKFNATTKTFEQGSIPNDLWKLIEPKLKEKTEAYEKYAKELNLTNLPATVTDSDYQRTANARKDLSFDIDLGGFEVVENHYNTKSKTGINTIAYYTENQEYALNQAAVDTGYPRRKSKVFAQVRVKASGSKDNASGIKTRGFTISVDFRTTEKTTNGIPIEKVLASKVIDEDFNKMLERVKGVKSEARYSEDRANKLAGNKGKFKFFVPYSAEDFVGLIYPTLGKGKEGDRNMQWYKETLLDPFAIGISNFEKAKQAAMNDWAELKKRIKNTPAGLKKEAVRGFTNEEAVRVYLWNENEVVPETLAKKDVAFMVKHVNDNKVLKDFAEGVKSVLGGRYPDPQGDWLAGTLTTDLINDVNTVGRKEFLQQWQENVDVVYSKDNMNKLKAIYGERYTEALENILHRMKTGRNRPGNKTRLENSWMDWVNDSVGTVMFFNTRSALLQTISSINFLNWSDNNPLMAGKAFANQPQFWKDFALLFNSDFLKQRRSGLKNDVNADEIANAAATSTNKVKAALSAMLQAGFLPTQMADSFAISIGGASFYRNRLSTYIKNGLSEKEASEKAMLDFQETAEESQQSSRPDRVSMQQAGSLGRVILAFANTPMQYTRLTKKAALDLANGRGDWKTNMSKILYYGAVQNIVFTALQQAMFAMLFDDDTEEEEKEASAKIVNGIADTFLRGSGVGGAAVATMKNIIMEVIKQKESKRPDYTKAALKATTLSPPIDTKIRKLMSAGRAFTYRQSLKDMKTKGISVDNPAALALGQMLSAAANVPADRAILKARNVKGALDSENETWQQIALALGYSDWQLGIKDDKSKTTNKWIEGLKKTDPSLYNAIKSAEKTAKELGTPVKKLERGVAGKAHNDGTIEVDPNLSPVEREKTIVHEKQHIKDMEAGRLDYDDNYVYWNGNKHERKNGKIKYKGKSYVEGHKSLPWEKKAYDAEPTTQEIKKRKKLY